jgi:molybdenum cofactor biosynthesis enzyme
MNETNHYKGMFDVSIKGDTLRIANAQAIIKVSSDSI